MRLRLENQCFNNRDNCNYVKIKKKETGRHYINFLRNYSAPSRSDKCGSMFIQVYSFYIAPLSVLLLMPIYTDTALAWTIPEQIELENENEAKLESQSVEEAFNESGRSLQFTNFFRNVFRFPSIASSRDEETGNGMNNNTSNSELLTKILQHVRIDQSSINQVQFYNADFENGNRNDSDGNSNSTEVPNVIFGSPLCLGLCLNGQFYAENTSIRLLSDKQYSLFGPRPNDSKSDSDPPDFLPSSPTIIPIQIAPGNTVMPGDENSILSWLSSWIYDIPLTDRLRNRVAQIAQLQYNPLEFLG